MIYEQIEEFRKQLRLSYEDMDNLLDGLTIREIKSIDLIPENGKFRIVIERVI